MSASEDARVGKVRLLRRSSRAIALLGVLVFLINFAALTPPSPYVVLWWLSLALWIVLGVAWIALVVQTGRRRMMRIRSSLWLFPVLPALIIGLSFPRVPFRVGFWVSRADMKRAAIDVNGGDRRAEEIHWVGIYPVTVSGQRTNPEVSFSIRGTGPVHCSSKRKSDSGFEYDFLPSRIVVFPQMRLGRVLSDNGPNYEDIGGGWSAAKARCY
jgi:hypothetical protein